MADSLRDQLLKSGIVRQTRKPKRAARRGPPRASGKARHDDAELDLAKAYAMRDQAEASERRRAKAEAEAKARARKERQRKLKEVLNGKVLNKADAEHARHFEYGGKIRRIHVDGEQLAALNSGVLAVVQTQGRYVLVTAEVAAQVSAFAPEQIALLVDPANATADDDVPDDLIW